MESKMEEYFVNKIEKPNGVHEVHKKNCFYLPLEINRISLGNFYNCQDALKKAEEYYITVDGCMYCSVECYKILYE